jgi:hypothetical protein
MKNEVKVKNDVEKKVLDYLTDNKDYLSSDVCDLHDRIFNTDYFIIGYYDSEKYLSENVGIFHAIEVVQNYEKGNFGDIYTDFSNSENLLNMFIYILGEKFLNSLKTIKENWDNKLNPEIIEEIIEEINGGEK